MQNLEKETYRIKELASDDRPRERLEKFGAEVLTNAELIAILIRVGVKGENAIEVSERILRTFGGLKGIQQASFDEMKDQHGLGFAKATTIKAAIELGRRLVLYSPEEAPAIRSPKDVADLLMYEMSALQHESLRVILLDTKNKVKKIVNLYKGTLDSSSVRVSEVFRDAIVRNASALILVHNHPSGDPTPSVEDVTLTKAVIEAGKLLNIEVHDHIIIGMNRYFSMKQKDLAF